MVISNCLLQYGYGLSPITLPISYTTEYSVVISPVDGWGGHVERIYRANKTLQSFGVSADKFYNSGGISYVFWITVGY